MVLSPVERLVTVIAREREVVLVFTDGSPTKPRHALEFREVQHAEPFDLSGIGKSACTTDCQAPL